MFKSLKRVTYQVPDVPKARDWYCKILRQEPALDSPFFVTFMIGDALLTIVPLKNQSDESNERAVAYWEVEDIYEAYNKLLNAGATANTEIINIVNVQLAKLTDPFGNIIGITSGLPDADKRAVEEQPSETAMTAAFCRAVSANDTREGLKGPDYLAEIFLTEDGKRPLKDPGAREWVINKLLTPQMYGYFIVRTAYIDSIVEKALSEKIPQIVFLGAGYDTRAYRFKDLITDTKIFELDIKTTQQRKIELLKQNNINIPEQLTFSTINFKTDKLEDVLLKSGFDPNKKSLFIWEGVMYYLSAADIDATLQFIKYNSPATSSVCFDYLTEKIESVSKGEPFQFWMDDENVESFLSERGYKLMEHLKSYDMINKYLTLPDGSQIGTVLPQFRLVYASLK